MIAYKCWSTNTYYGADGSKYECTSFLSGKSFEDLDFYRLIVRVEDRAYQIVKGMEERIVDPKKEKLMERLYFTPTITSDISVQKNKWKFNKMTLTILDENSRIWLGRSSLRKQLR